MFEEKRQEFELDEEKMHARSARTFHQWALRAKTQEDELLSVLDAIAKACRNLKKELDETQLRELYLIQELQSTEENSSSNNVIPKLVDELQVLQNENQRLFRETVIIKTENIHNKKLVEHLQLSIDRLQSVIEQLSSENHQLKLRMKLKDGEILSSSNTLTEIPKKGKFNPLADECLNKEVLFEDETTTQKLKKVQSEICRPNQEKLLLKMSADNSKLEAHMNMNRCKPLESVQVYAEESNTGFTLVPNIAADTKNLLKKLDEDNVLLSEKLLLAEEDRYILREEVMQYRKNASVSQQQPLQHAELYRASYDGKREMRHTGVKDDNAVCIDQKECNDRIDKNEPNSDSASENTVKDDYIESMNLLHMKLKIQNKSDDSSSVSGFSFDSKDNVYSRLPSPIHKSVSHNSGNDKDNVFSILPSLECNSISSLSSVDNISSIDDGEIFTMERKMSLGGMIACNADKSLVNYSEGNTSTCNFAELKLPKDVANTCNHTMHLKLRDNDCDKTLSQSDLILDSPRLVLGTSHILKNSLANVSRNLIDEEYFKTSSTPKSYPCNLPLLTDVDFRFQFNAEKDVSSDGNKEIIYEEFKIRNPNQSVNVLSYENKSDIGDEFKKLPNEIENPNRLHDTSPKAVNSSELNLSYSQKPEVDTRNIDWRNISVGDRVIESVITTSGSGLTVNNHLRFGKLAVYQHNTSLSQRDQHYANTIIDKYLRLLPLVPK